MKLNFSDKLLIDATEFLNAVYEDLTTINEILTLKPQTLLLEGTCLLFQGHTLASSLKHPSYLTPLLAICNMHDLFEKTTSELESFIDYFYVDGKAAGNADLSCDLSEEADEEHMMRVLEKDIYVKMEQHQLDAMAN